MCESSKEWWSTTRQGWAESPHLWTICSEPPAARKAWEEAWSMSARMRRRGAFLGYQVGKEQEHQQKGQGCVFCKVFTGTAQLIYCQAKSSGTIQTWVQILNSKLFSGIHNLTPLCLGFSSIQENSEDTSREGCCLSQFLHSVTNIRSNELYC